MATSSGKFDFFTNLITDTKKIHYEELDQLVENSRWLTTLVIAEIGGIAAYRKLLDTKSLSLPFTLIVLLLALTIVCFMVAVILSRKAKRNIANFTNHQIRKARQIESDGAIAPIQGDIQLNDLTTDSVEKISTFSDDAKFFESAGIILFILCSLCTTLVLFFNESLKLIGF
jgi:hypothetical protein